jgi:hypothetical protein
LTPAIFGYRSLEFTAPPIVLGWSLDHAPARAGEKGLDKPREETAA